MLRSRKGMHVPKAEGSRRTVHRRDHEALDMAVAIKADFVGLSFVRRPEDVERVRSLLPKRGFRPALVAKIETAAALDNLPGIVHEADAVMVARGDLGIQVPARRVPLLQKEIIRFCNMAGRPVITATQMLESMTRSPLPTRAEVNDVANAVIDGTDALMLSEETAVGAYPGRRRAHDGRRREAGRDLATRATLIPSARGRGRRRSGGVGRGACRSPGRAKTSASPRSCARPESGTTAAARRGVPAVDADRRDVTRRTEILGGLSSRVGRHAARGARDRRRPTANSCSRCRPHARTASCARATSWPSCSARTGQRAGSTDTVRVVRALTIAAPQIRELATSSGSEVVFETCGHHLAAVGAEVAAGELLDAKSRACLGRRGPRRRGSRPARRAGGHRTPRGARTASRAGIVEQHRDACRR